MKKIIISGGGTGGHVIPALAIAKELKELNFEILFIGNADSVENRLVTASKFAFKKINVQKLYRKFTFAHIRFPYLFIKSIIDCWNIFNDFAPSAYLGTGGFVSGPAGIVAWLKRIPIFLHEQNSFPGLTNRKIGKHATSLFLGHKGAAQYFPGLRNTYVGNPINPSVLNYKPIEASNIGLREDSIKLFLVGGSQGSYILNKHLFEIFGDLLEHNIEIIWQVGKFSFDEFNKRVGIMKGVYLFDFSNNMGALYELADIAIARAGALTLAELETKQIPAVLVPLENSAGNHQYYNAKEFVNKCHGIMIEQINLTPNTLKSEVQKLTRNLDKFKSNFSDSTSIHVEAGSKIANVLDKFVQ